MTQRHLYLLVVLLTLPFLSCSGEQPGEAVPTLVAPFTQEDARRAQNELSRSLGSPVEITNSIGMKLALIPPGEFLMGSSKEEVDGVLKAFPEVEGQWFDNESPKHRVRITKPFYLGVYEITVGQFRRFVEESGYKAEAERDGEGGWGWNEVLGRLERDPKYSWRDPGFAQMDDHPVVNVHWKDAVRFCNWLGHKEGLQPCYESTGEKDTFRDLEGEGQEFDAWRLVADANGYRLPTEAEWEYACRSGTTTWYSFGDDCEGLARVGNVPDAALKEKMSGRRWTIQARDGYVFTSPVGQFQANTFGLYDMHGNVCEWCADRYENYTSSAVDDPQGPSEGVGRAFRGGSWNDAAWSCRAADRSRFEPRWRWDDLGFRVVADPSGQSSKKQASGAESGSR